MNNNSTTNQRLDLLTGVDAIAELLNVNGHRAQHLIDSGENSPPAFIPVPEHLRRMTIVDDRATHPRTSERIVINNSCKDVPVVTNPRGTSGAGKSTLVRATKSDQAMSTPVFREGRGQPSG